MSNSNSQSYQYIYLSLYIYLVQMMVYEKFSSWNPTINSSINTIIIVLLPLHLRHRINIAPMYRTVIRNPSSILHSVDSIEGKKENKISAIFKQCVLFFLSFQRLKERRGEGKREKGAKEIGKQRDWKNWWHTCSLRNARLTRTIDRYRLVFVSLPTDVKWLLSAYIDL